MKRVIRLLIVLCAIQFLAPAAFAVDYYVDSVSGNDSWTGTLTDPNGPPANDGPWRSLDKIESFSSSPGFDPGDRIHFRRGQTFIATTAVSFSSSGSSGNPIEVTAYGSGGVQPVLQMSGYAITGWVPAGSDWFVAYTGTAVFGFWEDGYHLRSATSSALTDGNFYWQSGTGIYYRPTDGVLDTEVLHRTGAAYGFAISNQSYISFSDLHFRTGTAAIGGTSASSTIHNITISNCTFSDLSDPIQLFGDNGNDNHHIVIDNNHFLRTGNGIHIMAQGNGVETNDYIQITDNVIEDTDADGLYESFSASDTEAIGVQNLNNSIISGNVIFDGAEGGGISLWTHNSSTSNGNVIEKNTIRDIDGAGIILFGSNYANSHVGNVVSHNHIYNCSGTVDGGIRLSGNDDPGSNTISHNTIYGCDISIYLNALSGGFLLENNVSVNPGVRHVHHAGSTLASDFNWNVYYPLAADSFYFSSSGMTLGTWQSSPLFQDIDGRGQ